ncbi:MAG: endonuclease/exonuclease/phosphatase family protein [Pseudomonadota bacterium]
MRIATYNIEWFASLFDEDNQLIKDNSWSGRHDVTKAQQAEAIAQVLRAVDADAYMIIEAPNTGRKQNTIAALDHFTDHYGLRQNTPIVGFTNNTQQEIALLYDPTVLSAVHDPMGEESTADQIHKAPRFDGVFQLDINVDDSPDQIEFSKPPLELVISPNQGPQFRMIGVHAKSKAPHGARDERDAVRISIQNRRKHLAQSIWLRQRVDQVLARDEHLIVLGDFNDGPGLDRYEELFGHSGVEIVMGESKQDAKKLYDPSAAMALQSHFSASPTTARFYDHRTKTYLNALLDYIMISESLKALGDHRWTIWHPFNHPECYQTPQLQKALLTASDHFPVTLDVDFSKTA